MIVTINNALFLCRQFVFLTQNFTNAIKHSTASLSAALAVVKIRQSRDNHYRHNSESKILNKAPILTLKKWKQKSIYSEIILVYKILKYNVQKIKQLQSTTKPSSQQSEFNMEVKKSILFGSQNPQYFIAFYRIVCIFMQKQLTVKYFTVLIDIFNDFGDIGKKQMMIQLLYMLAMKRVQLDT